MGVGRGYGVKGEILGEGRHETSPLSDVVRLCGVGVGRCYGVKGEILGEGRHETSPLSDVVRLCGVGVGRGYGVKGEILGEGRHETSPLSDVVRLCGVGVGRGYGVKGEILGEGRHETSPLSDVVRLCGGGWVIMGTGLGVIWAREDISGTKTHEILPIVYDIHSDVVWWNLDVVGKQIVLQFMFEGGIVVRGIDCEAEI